MKATAVQLRVEIRIAWWIHPYLTALAFFCWVYGREPDEEKLELVVLKAIRIRLPGTRAWI